MSIEDRAVPCRNPQLQPLPPGSNDGQWHLVMRGKAWQFEVGCRTTSEDDLYEEIEEDD